ncbi:MAG: 2,3-bisphosphoglycerate-independent phosphoglycerate mutase [Holosporales bacterium]|jgi:2,3-bisphosphoglycerate-independent phosphoglycerate mutase|nr:2,3-bisphosphoglycerate-independent phosphoglycerate mutase [Holosporales bacterium]
MRKVLLCILDGFGCSDDSFGNATLAARYISDLIRSDGAHLLDASGEAVGLPDGQFGNSEVGHITIGAGAVIEQKLLAINKAIANGSLEVNPVLNGFVSAMPNSVCHLMGLFSAGGVHSSVEHFFWAVNFLRRRNVTIKAHLFLDGRDVTYNDALETAQNAIQNGLIGVEEIATIQGRFYAMDRDNRIERTKAAYEVIVMGKAEITHDNPIEVIRGFYEQDTFDEMIPPIVIGAYDGANPNDSFWMLNFRADRIRQIMKMLVDDKRRVLATTSCGDDIDSRVATVFESVNPSMTLGEILSNNGIRQLRIAETEKYAHVTYFLNGGSDIVFDLEDRILAPSPRVRDYSETPAMSALEITSKIIEAMSTSSSQVIIANFANADMLGHTGNFEATIASMKILDECVKRVAECANANGYVVVITADHGNAEAMLDSDMTPIKTHTCSKVPFVTIPRLANLSSRQPKTLADILGVITDIMGIH